MLKDIGEDAPWHVAARKLRQLATWACDPLIAVGSDEARRNGWVRLRSISLQRILPLHGGCDGAKAGAHPIVPFLYCGIGEGRGRVEGCGAIEARVAYNESLRVRATACVRFARRPRRDAVSELSLPGSPRGSPLGVPLGLTLAVVEKVAGKVVRIGAWLDPTAEIEAGGAAALRGS